MDHQNARVNALGPLISTAYFMEIRTLVVTVVLVKSLSVGIARINVRKSPEPRGNILWGQWILPKNNMAQFLLITCCGPKWWMDRWMDQLSSNLCTVHAGLGNNIPHDQQSKLQGKLPNIVIVLLVLVDAPPRKIGPLVMF